MLSVDGRAGKKPARANAPVHVRSTSHVTTSSPQERGCDRGRSTKIYEKILVELVGGQWIIEPAVTAVLQSCGRITRK